MNKTLLCTAVLLCSSAAAAAVEEIGPWTVESLSDDHSFSALGSMVAVERGFDRAAGRAPTLLIVGCDSDPAIGHAITVKTAREGFHVKPSGQSVEITVSPSFDDALPLEQRWSLFNSGPWIGLDAPVEDQAAWLALLARSQRLTLTLGGHPEIGIADRLVEFDIHDFSKAFAALTCGTP